MTRSSSVGGYSKLTSLAGSPHLQVKLKWRSPPVPPSSFSVSTLSVGSPSALSRTSPHPEHSIAAPLDCASASRACLILRSVCSPILSPYAFSSLGLRITAASELVIQPSRAQTKCAAYDGHHKAKKAGNALRMPPASNKARPLAHDWGSDRRALARNCHTKRTDIVKQTQGFCHA